MKVLRRLIFPLSATTFFDVSKLFTWVMSSSPFVSPSLSSALQVRIASYNVLSSHLADPRHFSTLNPDHLLASNRLPAVLQQLDEQIDENALICLQEVSHDWAGKIHTHLANKGYQFVFGPYGKPFNGYMGVAVAWPAAAWKVLDVDISRLADKREGGWPRPPKEEEEESFLSVTRILKSCKWIVSRLARMVRPYLERVGLVSRLPIDHWHMSSQRWNILITVKLQDKVTQQSLALGNYHMPCAYYAPMVMTLHVDLAARHVQRLAGTMPYVLAGDWNIKPDSSSYRLLTTGQMDKGDPDWPTPKHGIEWAPSAKPMRSAYAEVDAKGKEPDFTNYARIKEQEPFIETLDYIFLSPQWNVKAVKDLPSRDAAGGPFPNLDRGEPSDHILVAADLELKK